MNIVSHEKGWGVDTNPAHVGRPTILLIREMSTGKPDGDDVKLNLCRDPTSSMLDLYNFRMSLFGHGDPEEFLLFVQNFQMILSDTGMLETKVKFCYICTLVSGEALCQFDLVCADAKI